MLSDLHFHDCQFVHVDHPTAQLILKHPDVAHVQFTGSVRGGFEVMKSLSDKIAGKMIHELSTIYSQGVGLELGGKDPAYVREDADLSHAAENVVDGALYNSGQSCCAVERVYVHEKVYDDFVNRVVEIVKGYKLGNPFDEGVNLGPVVNLTAANTIRNHIKDAGTFSARSSKKANLFQLKREHKR